MSPSLTSGKKGVISTSYLPSSQDESVKIIAKQILTYLLKSLNESKPNLLPGSIAITQFKHIALSIFSIEMKYISPQMIVFSRKKISTNV